MRKLYFKSEGLNGTASQQGKPGSVIGWLIEKEETPYNAAYFGKTVLINVAFKENNGKI